MRIRSFVLILLTFLAVAPAAAAPRRPPARGPAFEAGFLFNLTDFEDEALLDEDMGFSPRFGILVDPHHEIEFLISHVQTNDIIVPAIEVDIEYFQVAYVYNFTRRDLVPYFTAGVGWIESDAGFVGSEDNPVFSLGGGIKLFLGKVAHLRFELRQNFFEGEGVVFGWQEDVSMLELGFGLGWRF